MCKYIKKTVSELFLNGCLLIKITKNAYIKGPTKRQCIRIKQAFIKNYHDIDGNYNLVPSPEIEVVTWTIKKESEKK